MSADPRNAKDFPTALQSDQEKGMLSQSCLDLLMVEMVPLSQRITEQLHADNLRYTGAVTPPTATTVPNANQFETIDLATSSQALVDSQYDTIDSPYYQMRQAALSNGHGQDPEGMEEKTPGVLKSSSSKKDRIAAAGARERNTGRIKLEEDKIRDGMAWRLDSWGYRVGQGVVESLSASHPLLPRAIMRGPDNTPQLNPQAALDTLKFLCKELWTALFRKQIDNLKTNHRGVFVLTDNSFTPVRRCSIAASMNTGPGSTGQARTDDEGRRASLFLHYPTGLIRGALVGLGIEPVHVDAQIASVGLPSVIITVKLGPAAVSGGGAANAPLTSAAPR